MGSRIKLDNLLVVDLEATCWKNRFPPDGQTQDIIQIGICSVDMKPLTRHSKTSFLIRPTRSKISEYCTELTGLRAEHIKEEGVDFAHACKRIKTEFGSRRRVWASWGDYDRTALDRQCRDFDVDYPFSHRHVNIKTLFALKHGLTREIGLARAFEYLGLELEGRHHDGADDAWNTALLMINVLNDQRKVT